MPALAPRDREWMCLFKIFQKLVPGGFDHSLFSTRGVLFSISQSVHF